MKFSEFRLDRTVVALFLFGWLTYFALTFNVKPANAVSNPSGLTGQYGCMANRNTAGYNFDWTGGQYATQVIFYVDYSNNTTQGLLATVDNFNVANTSTLYESITSTFTETSVANIKSVYKQVHTLTKDGQAAGTLTMIVMSVNSGNTLLVSQADKDQTSANWSGVCQKV